MRHVQFALYLPLQPTHIAHYIALELVRVAGAPQTEHGTCKVLRFICGIYRNLSTGGTRVAVKSIAAAQIVAT